MLVMLLMSFEIIVILFVFLAKDSYISWTSPSSARSRDLMYKLKLLILEPNSKFIGQLVARGLHVMNHQFRVFSQILLQ
jgi:hypothetical protein